MGIWLHLCNILSAARYYLRADIDARGAHRGFLGLRGNTVHLTPQKHAIELIKTDHLSHLIKINHKFIHFDDGVLKMHPTKKTPFYMIFIPDIQGFHVIFRNTNGCLAYTSGKIRLDRCNQKSVIKFSIAPVDEMEKREGRRPQHRGRREESNSFEVSSSNRQQFMFDERDCETEKENNGEFDEPQDRSRNKRPRRDYNSEEKSDGVELVRKKIRSLNNSGPRRRFDRDEFSGEKADGFRERSIESDYA
ncbi:hypothetical protein ECANGB1_1920 [Enterospora canceri]|uniref:Uncharacterized protein n=1 Tax=Enterospora canceri TaxID=1081671 RepID=A0A1Y1S9T3_9MICR|nr:hypothetical protein ECANGB1_1920 [Enterospora canceri]